MSMGWDHGARPTTRRMGHRLAGRGLLGSIVALAALLAGTLAAAAPVAARQPGPMVGVLVRGAPGQAGLVAADIGRVGGHLTRRLAVLDGAAASVPAAAVDPLRHLPGVTGVSPDGPVRLQSIDPTLGYDPQRDFGSLYQITKIVGAQDSWTAGYTGAGIDVALIDSGVSPVPGLTSGNVVNGPDLSFESQYPDVADRDTFGHGTHMASIIVGRDAAGSAASYASPAGFAGVAPDARLVSLKVAANDGASDVSQVIAAIDWVVAHAHDPGFNIRVLNLSFGTDSTQDYRLDPLAYAAEAAWRSGIVVVVAGGNDGKTSPTLADPAIDPYLLAVGGADPHGTIDPKDDQIPAFSQRGTTARHVDLIAPGVHVLGLRDSGGAIDQAYPAARVGTRFFRGSGTSQATAVVSGLAALLLQRYPSLTPYQAKQQLMATATAVPGPTINQGAGVPNVRKAQLATPPGGSDPAAGYASGSGTLEGARGSAHVTLDGVDLTGERDIFGAAWNPSAWASAALAASSWSGGVWNGNDWTGNDWTGSSWTSRTWSSRTWSGASWTGAAWTSRTWSSRTWSASGWDSRTWSGSGWSSRTWTDSTWSSASWS
jgi:serine protease AprX